jgi:hypothetical protein
MAPVFQAAPDTSIEPVRHRADWFRVFLFGSLGLFYAVIMLPLAVAAVAFWLLGKALDRSEVADMSATMSK